MLKGYVSSDSDDLDDLDEFYCESPVKIKEEPRPPIVIQNEKLKDKLFSAMKEEEKISAFLKAADDGDLETIEELISLGVSVDCSKKREWTALLKACAAGNFDIVQFLLEHGSDPNLHKELITPLMVCCTHSLTPESSKLSCVRLLLQHGADVNAKDKYRTTALMYASESNYNDIVTELLAVPDIDINVQDKEGLNALFYAVYSNNLNIAEALKSAGIDLTLKDRFNRTVVNLALENGLLEMAKLLGYVEEKTDFQEKVTEASYRFLEQLPDSNGAGGFNFDVKHTLASLELQDVKEISFPDFLNITDAELCSIGVKIKPHREKILSLIHLFHLHPWTKFSIHEINPEMPLNTENAIAITGDLAKHLTLANASLRYLESRLNSRMDNDKYVNLTNEEDLIFTLIDIYQAAEKMNVILPKIIRHINQIEPDVLGDYIFPYKESKQNRIPKYLWCSCGITAIGLLLNIFYPEVVGNIIGKMCSFMSLTKLFFEEPEPPKVNSFISFFL